MPVRGSIVHRRAARRNTAGSPVYRCSRGAGWAPVRAGWFISPIAGDDPLVSGFRSRVLADL